MTTLLLTLRAFSFGNLLQVHATLLALPTHKLAIALRVLSRGAPRGK